MIVDVSDALDEERRLRRFAASMSSARWFCSVSSSRARVFDSSSETRSIYCGSRRRADIEGAVGDEAVPGFEHEPLRPVLAEFLDLVLLEHAECLGRVVLAHDGLRVEDVFEFAPGQAVEIGVVGVEFGPKQRPPLRVPAKGRAVVPEILGEGAHVLGGIGEFEDSLDDETRSPGTYWSGAGPAVAQHEELEISAADFLPVRCNRTRKRLQHWPAETTSRSTSVHKNGKTLPYRRLSGALPQCKFVSFVMIESCLSQ